MKKFFEKYDLIKLSGIMVLIIVLLTWFIPAGSFSGTEFVTKDITRVGISDFLLYGLMGIYNFSVLVTFLFVLGGFYQVLSHRAGYQRLIKNISEKLKGCEIPTVLVISLIFAILGSLVNEYFPLLAFIPFVITILNKMKVDKISAFVATFGGLLVGTIGSTFSVKLAGEFTQLGIQTADILTTQTILFVIAYILLAAFTIIRLRKNKDKKPEEYDMFLVDNSKESKKAPKTWPYVIGIILFAIVTVLAYLPWSTWEITFFTDLTEKINTFELFKVPIVTYIFGEFAAFGTWDIFAIQKVMILATVLIWLIGHMSLSDIFECYGTGFKKIGKVIVIMLVVYTIVTITYFFPILPAIANWLAGLTEGFNAFLTYISSFIVSMFSVEMRYQTLFVGSYYINMYAELKNVVVMIMQMTFGLASFFVPSSAILMMGLSYLDIKYKDWMKFIWKFLLAILIISIVIILIIA